MSIDELDRQFAARVKGAWQTAKAWDADPQLLRACRESIPSRIFDVTTILDSDEDYQKKRNYSCNGRVLQNLVRYVQKDVMTWINQPPCQHCTADNNNNDDDDGDTSATTMTLKETRGPQTSQEHTGRASRVEVYECSICHQETPFPRYNHVETLFRLAHPKNDTDEVSTRSKKCPGRCGEYANLFGLYCRAVGFETRYVLDFTDHVWTEVWIPGGLYHSTASKLQHDHLFRDRHWTMVDSCEGIVGEPSLYEKGWGKSLSYVIAASSTHVVDVTTVYTRKFFTPDFQARRRTVNSSEQAGRICVEQIQHQVIEPTLPPKLRSEVQEQVTKERALLQKLEQATTWDTYTVVGGRTSGSLAWRVARNEVGKTDNKDKDNSAPSEPVADRFQVESFYPTSYTDDDPLVLVPTPKSPSWLDNKAISVRGTLCSVSKDIESALNVVVLDSDYLGCILQSRSFHTLQDFVHFVERLPQHRIVVLHGCLSGTTAMSPSGEGTDLGTRAEKCLGGLDSKLLVKGLVYIGQIGAEPDWTVCACLPESDAYGYRLDIVDADIPAIQRVADLKLKTERHVRPACIASRLPESVMPLQSQLLAGEEQKRTAFLRYYESESSSISGYTTKNGAPIYLLDNSSYPLEYVDSEDEPWNSFLLLPPPLVGDDDAGIREGGSKPQFDIPIEADFFLRNLGPELLVKQESATIKMDTIAALNNARLVGLYFSAHWCGPCRSFTPLLAEMYQHLKDQNPSHGLEIVFVSSDRDLTSFAQYYNSMPWMAIPFDGPSFASIKSLLSTTYGVRGIPSFVVLDSMTGQIIVPANQSRGEVMQACNQGEERIEALLSSWLDRVPTESKEMLAMLELSCAVDTLKPDETEIPYLISDPSNQDINSKEQIAEKVKAKFAQLVKEGMSPNEAAAKAIAVVSSDSTGGLGPGPLSGCLKSSSLTEKDITPKTPLRKLHTRADGIANVRSILETLLKYVENLQGTPWNPKFRVFKLSNKIADRITRIPGGIDLIRSLGIECYLTDQDAYANIPVNVDLNDLKSTIIIN